MRKIWMYKGLLSLTIKGFKSAITKYTPINQIELRWLERFHDQNIRDQIEYNRIALYIGNTAASTEMDKYSQKIKNATLQ